MTKTPRDYQVAANEAVWKYFQEGKTGNPVVALPTGTGKSLINALMIMSMIKAYPHTRILCLTHVKELIANNHETLMEMWPSAPAGIFSAGLKRKDLHAQITFAGIASIVRRAKLFAKTNIIIIDECHLVSDNESARYLTLIKELKRHNPKLKVIGLTATPFRNGLGMITDGKLFDEICFDVTSGTAFVWMIEQGYLAPVVPKKPLHEIDTDSVKINGGEFAAGELSDAVDNQGIIADALDEALELAKDCRRWLVFAPSIKHCEQIVVELESRGIAAETVHSKMDGDRDQILANFKQGKFRALVNKDILTTGFDDPEIDCIIMLRPTRSAGLWVQMLGRGTRPVFAPGFDINTQEGRLAAIAAGPKQRCLVLDFAGNTERLGPINYPSIPKRRGAGGGEAPVRTCPECATMVHISIRVCPECGYEFPPPQHIQASASTGQLVQLSSLPEIPPPEYAIFEVSNMLGTLHQKAGKKDSVRVDYFAGVRRFSCWVGVEHTGGMLYHSKNWWAKHAPQNGAALPQTTNQLLDVFSHVRTPTHIKVIINRKYPEIVDYDFTGTGFVPNPERVFLEPGEGTGADKPEDSRPDRGGKAASFLSDMHDFR